MPLSMISETVEKGVGKTLQGIALLVGLGSMFGGILEASGGAQKIAETLIDKFGQKKAGWALGITGLVIGTTVFFEAGVVVLIPLVFRNLALPIYGFIFAIGSMIGTGSAIRYKIFRRKPRGLPLG